MVVDINTESEQHMAVKALEALDLAKKTGKVKKGINEVTKIVERGLAKLVVIAKDVSPKEILMHLPLLCEEKGVPLIIISSKEDLGATVGLSVGTSAAVVVHEGEAKALIKQLQTK